jgi:hypothetical protein
VYFVREKILTAEFHGEISPGRRRRWEDNIKVNLKEIGCVGMHFIGVG